MLSAQGLLSGAALAFMGGRKLRTRVYVDGFNLYYGALKGTQFKWLDPVGLTASLLPREYVIDRLRYFTARVSGKVDPRAPARQRVHLKALATLPEVDIHYGRFLSKTAWRPLANLPVANRRIDAPRPATLPEGYHRVVGERPRMLPVGHYPNRRGGYEGASRRPRALANRTAVAASRQPCPPRSTRDAEGRAASGLDPRHRHSETRTLVAGSA